MGDKEFALAIATDYIAPWSRFTQASLARYIRLVRSQRPRRR